MILEYLQAADRQASRLIDVDKLLYASTVYPFTREDLYRFGSEVYFDHFNQLITADSKKQHIIDEVFRAHCSKISFENKIAAQYYPRGEDAKIVVDPKIQFGSPVIAGTRITIDTIYQMYKGGDSVDLISNIFSISKDSVKASIDYFGSAA